MSREPYLRTDYAPYIKAVALIRSGVVITPTLKVVSSTEAILFLRISKTANIAIEALKAYLMPETELSLKDNTISIDNLDPEAIVNWKVTESEKSPPGSIQLMVEVEATVKIDGSSLFVSVPFFSKSIDIEMEE